MDIADETGMLILSEGFDMWERSKTDYDYARFFDEWVEKDVASWVRRDRNRPSIIGWSVGNEIFDTHADERGQEVTAWLKRLVKLHDPEGNGYVTFGSNYMQWENGQKCADILKLAGYNYGERLYEEHHAAHPDWMIYGSETASVVQSRGIYHFPLSETLLTDDDEQCSSLGNSCTGWGAKNTEACIIPDRDAEYCAGQFIWTGFDYIGEPTPYSTKNSYFGQFDTAGFAKDSAYVFRAEWTDYKAEPFVHIFPYWDFSDGLPCDVRVCSNAPRVELFKDGVSMGAYDIDHKHGKELTANYVIPYEKGELKAVAYDENGNIIAEDIQRSFGDAVRIEAVPDKTEILADGSDLVYIEISAFDKDGTFCANANNRVNVSVEGAARLMGLDNGDSTDYDQYKGTSRRLFSGKMLAVIGSTDKTGEIKVTLASKGLPDEKAYDNINAYNQIFVDSVRATGSNNEKRWLLLPGWNTNIEYTAGDDYNFKIPTDKGCKADGKRIMISVHYYDPFNFTIDENKTAKTQWGKYAVKNYDNWGQEDYVDSQMALLNEKFVSQGYPVVIGEFGAQDKTEKFADYNEFRRYWSEYLIKAAKKNGVVCVYWDNGYNGNKGFGIINRFDYTITQPDLIAGMMRAINSTDDYEIPSPAGYTEVRKSAKAS